eukprot:scaffold6450_cov415-Prasinococcus_capsulatus_cf.AAC.4
MLLWKTPDCSVRAVSANAHKYQREHFRDLATLYTRSGVPQRSLALAGFSPAVAARALQGAIIVTKQSSFRES